jgi:hypothetical protein
MKSTMRELAPDEKRGSASKNELEALPFWAVLQMKFQGSLKSGN